jgi:hypothetical protein
MGQASKPGGWIVDSEKEQLRREVEVLRDKVQRLRQSRRVLMVVLAQELHERQGVVTRLENENRRLRRQNSRMARAAWQRSAGRGPRASSDRRFYP